MKDLSKRLTRRDMLKSTLVLAGCGLVPGAALGLDGTTAANERVTMALIGCGGQGRGDMSNFLGFPDFQVIACCDVVRDHFLAAKRQVDGRYGNSDCETTYDYRDIAHREDIDTVLIATPDHWHENISIYCMKYGKDVYCEKPETLTINAGKRMREAVNRFNRVFSGGSLRVWQDYQGIHKLVRAGVLGEVKEGWANVWGPSGEFDLPAQETPEGVDWDRWCGPTVWHPFNQTLIKGGFRPYRDYSGGGTTDWGCHTFGGIMFAMDLQDTGPVEINPPSVTGKGNLTFVFANGFKMHHGGGWDGVINLRGTEGDISEKDMREGKYQIPDIYIPNYHGGADTIYRDFANCVRTRQKPFRNIERAHRTATCAHLGNIAYWLDRTIHWDPVAEEIVGDPEAALMMDRAKRAPYII